MPPKLLSIQNRIVELIQQINLVDNQYYDNINESHVFLWMDCVDSVTSSLVSYNTSIKTIEHKINMLLTQFVSEAPSPLTPTDIQYLTSSIMVLDEDTCEDYLTDILQNLYQ